MTGCASLPPGSDFPRPVSQAYAHPEQTLLGRNTETAANSHPGKSGFRILTQGIDGLLTRAQMINRAERTLDLLYYIFHNDESGQLLSDALLHAADRGVRVRILLDDGETIDGDEKIAALQAHPNITIRIFNPFRYRGHVDFFRMVEFITNHSRLNYRMHNKLLVVDNALALIGGRNIADGYFQIDPDSQFGDDDIFSVGPVVQKLSGTFDEFWNNKISIPSEALTATSESGLTGYRLALTEHCSQLTASAVTYATSIRSGEPLTGMLSGTLPLIWADAQVVYDSPDKSHIKKDEMKGRLISQAVMASAENVRTELIIISPYLIPGKDGMTIIQNLHEHKAKIRILTNSLISNNVALAHAGYMHYRHPLLEAGVELYEVRASLGNSRGSGQNSAMSKHGNYALHAKLFVFDRKKLFIGSMNFDQRSIHINTEIGLLIDSPELAQQTAARFDAITRAENSYGVVLSEEANGTPHLEWHTLEAGKSIIYIDEPARSHWQKLKVRVLSLFPVDDEL